jgi:hypothetical protein
MIESLGVLGTCLLYRLYASEVLHGVHLLIEVLCAEVTEVRECEYRFTFFGFLGRNLNDLFLFNDFDLSLEEAFTSDHLSVFDYHRLHLGW